MFCVFNNYDFYNKTTNMLIIMFKNKFYSHPKNIIIFIFINNSINQRAKR